jgi:membrane-bound lytic murein transglycosylase D
MLKRKLYKAGFLVSSFIFVAMASGSRWVNNNQLFFHPAEISRSNDHHFDSSGLCACVPVSDSSNDVDDLRIQLNKNVATFVNEYNRKNGYFIGKSRTRITRYFTIIDSVLKKNDLPLELKYLAYIESGLKYNAISWAGAVGPWALMPAAAKQYGLKISKGRDERLDYYKSTKAASALLKDLYKQYGDWLTVIAAYNCGPGNVQKAIRRSGTRNYWSFQQFLPLETRAHVKKFIAVHYYFEGHGSLVTLSKAETEKHISAVEKYIARQKELEKIDSLSTVQGHFQ